MDTSTIVGLISAVGIWATVVAAGIILWRQNRNAKELTCLQLYLQLAAQYDSPEMNFRRARLASQLLRDPASHDIDDSVLVFFENVGLMVKRGLLDLDLIDNVLGFDLRNYWTALEPYRKYLDEQFGEGHTLFIQFKYLVEESSKHALEEYGQKQGYLTPVPFSTQLFLEMEQRRDPHYEPRSEGRALQKAGTQTRKKQLS